MLANLKAEMARYGISTLDIAKVAQRTNKSIRDKISGKTDFTMPEGLAIRNALFPGLSLEYLFASEDAAENQRDRPA